MHKYQHDYASGRPQMYDSIQRKRKAIRMVKLLQDYFGKGKIKHKKVLDVGASTGIIDNELSKYFKTVIGIDIDKDAIKFANKTFKKKNLKFIVNDAMKLSFMDSSFDIVICAQVYEHVPNARTLFNEIYRVLKPGGVCYLAALNKYWPIEPHYNLPFLSWIPKNIGNYYVKLAGKAPRYYETLKSYWQLHELAKKFEVLEYTSKILRDPKKFGYESVSRFPISIIAWVLSSIATYSAPTFFWLLRKNTERRKQG